MDVVNGKCDCPVRTKGNELYWNGADCVPANTYGGSCSSAELFKCQTLTLGLTCINNKCDCKDGVWDPVKGNEWDMKYDYTPPSSGIGSLTLIR